VGERQGERKMENIARRVKGHTGKMKIENLDQTKLEKGRENEIRSYQTRGAF